MELLTLLASRQGQLVTRAEIAERLWSREVFVDTEHGINTAVRKLRQLLRDDAEEPKYIQTVTGMGYRFVSAVCQGAAVDSAEPIAVAEPAPPLTPDHVLPSKHRAWALYAGVGLCALLAFGGTGLYRLRHQASEVRYTQLTDFTDSAVQPALSPDGRMLAFIRGGDTFMTPDQIYVKMLPDGEARRVTDDSRAKYGLTFSPDGSEIAYTVLEGSTFSTYVVSALGGEPRLMFKNAAGLVWLDAQRILFSQAPSGIHLSVVKTGITRTGSEDLYSPSHERGMAHYSFPSPDRRWAIVVEMNGNGEWGACRLIAVEGQHSSRTVGPNGGCTSAGWSPDGRWMFFTATLALRSHVWRQRFPEGVPEQITFGPTEEDGVVVEPEGNSIITSVGVYQTSIWVHDGSGDRSLSSEGEVLWWPTPVFSEDGKTIYYLVRRRDSPAVELWQTVVDSGKSEAVFPGVSLASFDISPDGNQVVYTTNGENGSTELWLAAMDRSSPAKRLGVSGARGARFGGHGEILFQRSEGGTNYLDRVDADGGNLAKALPYPISDFQSISPGRRWVILAAQRRQDSRQSVLAVSLENGAQRDLCVNYCAPKWSPDGKFLFIPDEYASRTGPGRTLAIPLGPGEALPDFPTDGIPPQAEASVVRGAKSIPRGVLVPGRDLTQYAWINATVQRNLYRISMP
ncbi:MAG: PD40 domain-containing protein [Acidobacteria bacterium]|nr:PD40 domain-containing protein [Acidobacteriota bacterium]